jgi:hypothetical protein
MRAAISASTISCCCSSSFSSAGPASPRPCRAASAHCCSAHRRNIRPTPSCTLDASPSGRTLAFVSTAHIGISLNTLAASSIWPSCSCISRNNFPSQLLLRVPLLGTSHSSIACSCPWARSAPAAQHLHTPPPSARHCAHACATRSASLTFALAPPANRSSAHSPALHRCELLHCQLCRSRVCVTPAHRQLAGHARVCSWIAPAPCVYTHAAAVSLCLWPLAPTRRSRAACAKLSRSPAQCASAREPRACATASPRRTHPHAAPPPRAPRQCAARAHLFRAWARHCLLPYCRSPSRALPGPASPRVHLPRACSCGRPLALWLAAAPAEPRPAPPPSRSRRAPVPAPGAAPAGLRAKPPRALRRLLPHCHELLLPAAPAREKPPGRRRSCSRTEGGKKERKCRPWEKKEDASEEIR